MRKGQTLVELALLLAFVFLVAVAALTAFSLTLGNSWNTYVNTLPMQ
ncbi:MAG: hypothetical protein NZ959_01545 [Armatimonadetes bacterium]|nr:hypothetical protein [Armatimonadota bacterium]MDW8121344.1 hypothetical protein [Armatimonadota bacterium]